MESLATELLHEIKRSAMRWFVVAVIELVMIIIIMFGFLWYISLPIEETTTTEQSVEDVSCGDISQNITVN